MDGTNPMGGGGMTPEQMQAYLDFVSGQGSFTEQDRAIQQQLAEADALRNPHARQHLTGMGAALGGLGDILNIWTGSREQGRARGQDAALQQARIDALRKLAGTGMQQAQQAQPAAPYGNGWD